MIVEMLSRGGGGRGGVRCIESKISGGGVGVREGFDACLFRQGNVGLHDGRTWQRETTMRGFS